VLIVVPLRFTVVVAAVIFDQSTPLYPAVADADVATVTCADVLADLYTPTTNDSASVSACVGAYVQIPLVLSHANVPDPLPHDPVPVLTRTLAPLV